MALQQQFYQRHSGTALPIVRNDSLPEGAAYRDEGCSISPSCLKCPLAVCRYDDLELRRRNLHGKIREMRAAKFSVAYVAQHFGLSTRTIHRVTHRAQK